ncbi:BamA/TamA family outer membrane protein [Ekhidna sp.]
MNGIYAQSSLDTVRLTQKQALIISDSIFIPKKDTIIFISDTISYRVYDNKYVLSDGFYDSVYAVARQSRVTKELYNLLINSNPTQGGITDTEPVKSESFFEEFEGKTINSIQFVTVDILGGDINDTTRKAQSSIGELSNQLHQNTRKNVIKKHLLFNIRDKVDPFEVADTERVIRSLAYIEDIRIKLKIDPDDTNGVIVTVISKDRFPWSPDLSIDENSAFRVGFINQNILGTGNEFGVGYLYAKNDVPSHGFDAQYTIRNVDDSFIDATLFVSDNYRGKSKGITFSRNFVSPDIKYNGEATFEHVQPIRDLVFADSLYEENFSIERKSYDIWAARSFLLQERRSLSLALRLDHDNFSERPIVQIDSNEIYHNHHFLVGAVSFSQINFLKTKNILSFNITEDVPVGYLFSFLLGKDWTEFGTRNYRGFLGSFSTYNKKKGYFLFDLESGYFLRDDFKTNVIFQFKGRHFTPLIDLNGAYSRIFTRFYFFNGNRLSIPESQSLVGENRIRSIEGNQIEGDRVISLSSEYVVFQPWYFYGFRFATYAHLGIGHVQESRISTPFSETYYNFGGGVRIRNESLVFNTFEFRVSIFPEPPIEGQVFYFKVNLSAPRFFESPTVKKPRIVGLD